MAEAPVVQWLLWNPSGTSLQFDPFEPRELIECIETLQKWNLLQNSGNSFFMDEIQISHPSRYVVETYWLASLLLVTFIFLASH